MMHAGESMISFYSLLVMKYLSGGFLVFLWILYVIFSSLQSYDKITSPF